MAGFLGTLSWPSPSFLPLPLPWPRAPVLADAGAAAVSWPLQLLPCLSCAPHPQIQLPNQPLDPGHPPCSGASRDLLQLQLPADWGVQGGSFGAACTLSQTSQPTLNLELSVLEIYLLSFRWEKGKMTTRCVFLGPGERDAWTGAARSLGLLVEPCGRWCGAVGTEALSLA